jgi:uncharacterized protein (TIGR04222 family)
MDHLWGISGTLFLLLYGVVLVALTVFAVVVRRRVLDPPAYEPVDATDLPALAVLVNGQYRLIELAIARLIEAGAARVNREGVITGLAVTPDDPLDAAVLRAMGTRPRHRYDLIRAVMKSDEVRTGHLERVERTLAAGRQLITAELVRKTRRTMVRGLWLLLAVGIGRWCHGLAAGRPIGFLTVELVVTAIVIQVLRVREFPTRTTHGDRTVADARANATGMARVALHGLSEYPDEEIRRALRSPDPRIEAEKEQARSRGTTSDSTIVAGGVVAGYSGDDSGCGSGGCGGGCGGCGGCG